MRNRKHKDKELEREIKKMGRVCQFTFKGERCKEPATAIIRCMCVCPTHFKTIRADNIKQINLGNDIPEDLEFVKRISIAQARHKIKVRK